MARLSPGKLLTGIPLFDAAKAHRTDSKARDVTKVSNKSDPCEQTFNMSNVVSDREGKRLSTKGLDMEQFKAKVMVNANQNPQATAMIQVHSTCLGNDCNLVPLRPSVRRRSILFGTISVGKHSGLRLFKVYALVRQLAKGYLSHRGFSGIENEL